MAKLADTPPPINALGELETSLQEDAAPENLSVLQIPDESNLQPVKTCADGSPSIRPQDMAQASQEIEKKTLPPVPTHPVPSHIETKSEEGQSVDVPAEIAEATPPTQHTQSSPRPLVDNSVALSEQAPVSPLSKSPHSESLAQEVPQAAPSSQLASSRAAPSVTTPTPDSLKSSVAAPHVPNQHAVDQQVQAGAKKTRPPQVKSSTPPTTSGKGAGDPTIRVDVSLLDRLMNLVGELVLARNQVLQFSSKSEDPNFITTSQRLNHITTELQEGLMKTRMQPIKSVWSKFPRVVRDLSRTCKKDVKIVLEGEDTELDRTIIEAIKDPMTHIVRNSVDHGIETPEERQRRGKPAQGRLTLRAFHEGGKVNIEILDDGKGLDIKRIKEKALEKEVVTAAQLARMPERDVMQLIFAPGFSTAAAVTQVSGRGVGMDVVKTNIERIGGTIELSSRMNLGTSLKIKIPLTLAIIPALVVDCSGDSYAIPQVNLLELVRYEKSQAETAIEYVHGAPVCRLRGNLLPLVFLHEVLGVAPRVEDEEAIFIVVLQADERHFGLVVDHVSDTEEIVVKPLGKELKSAEVYAGATIMGDGRVALILDVLGVALAGNLLSQERVRRLKHVGASDRDTRKKYAMLVFRINENERGAVPLKAVARLEEIPRSRIEHSGGDEVVQYRGSIMPLLRIAPALGHPERPATETEQVIVFQKRNRTVGIIVDGIEDVVNDHIEVHRPLERVGVTGQAVLQGRVTELVDLAALVEQVFPNFFDVEAAE